MSAPASKIKEQGGKTLYFLAKILYINPRGQGKNRPILLREVINLVISLRAGYARA
jgi:flagellar biosynthesis regulator FlbT